MHASTHLSRALWQPDITCMPPSMPMHQFSLSLFCSPPLSLASSLSPSLSFSYPLTYTTRYLIHTFQLWLPHASCCSMTVYTYTYTHTMYTTCIACSQLSIFWKAGIRRGVITSFQLQVQHPTPGHVTMIIIRTAPLSFYIIIIILPLCLLAGKFVIFFDKF